MSKNNIQISSQKDLLKMRDSPEEDFILTNDVTFEEVDNEVVVKTFEGSLNGNGHKIKNHNDKHIISDNKGLIKNLKLISTGTRRLIEEQTGGIVCINNGRIVNCEVSGLLRGNWLGGIANGTFGIIENCRFEGIIESEPKRIIDEEEHINTVGGIVANVPNEGTIKDCHTSGKIIGGEIGGIAGRNHTRIKNCSSEMHLKSSEIPSDEVFGGIVGDNFGLISGSYFHGKLDISKSSEEKGYICGLNREKVKNCYCVGEERKHNLIGKKSGKSDNIGFKKSIDGAESAVIAHKL